MNTSKVITAKDQEHFYAVVAKCLREFHGRRRPGAMRKLQDLQARVVELSVEAMELFFHSEPFDVACQLAEQPLQDKDYLDRYLAIRDAE